MKQALKKFILVFILFIAFFIFQKLLFIIFYHNLSEKATLHGVSAVIYNGLSMDCSIAGYLSVLPGMAIIAEQWITKRWLMTAQKIYFAIISSVLAIITIFDLALYGYWGFRLDMTPLFYLTTSPAAAMASVEWWQLVVGLPAIAITGYGLYKLFSTTVLRISPDRKKRMASTILMTLLTAALFIPIRGGITVSTMNLSRAYFSEDQFLNHAAVNPAFSLMYSATHQTDFGSQYRFMSDSDASKAINSLNKPILTEIQADTTITLSCQQPDIYLIILESFSAHLMESLGGENIAVNLDSLAKEGVLFSNFYANSFRTDRALPAILSGFPSQPSMSIMKFVEKTERLPSISRQLKTTGYEPSYYYGGDINFTNMKAYLVNSGFNNIICDKDFHISQRMSKWGAPDHVVFERALTDVIKNSPAKPRFTVIQTSSSHEPFEVPYSNPRFADNPQKNAFAYTDSCLMAFIDGLKQLPSYNRSLILMVPDHQGAWPNNFPQATDRHHVPLVMAGGALNANGETINVAGSQNDIAATLLGMLGIDHSMFPFSHDMLDPSAPHYGVFTQPSLAGIVTSTDTVVINTDSEAVLTANGNNPEKLVNQTKAYLQTLYDYIEKL